ncbi:MAG: polysaccharide deacetylase family protein [Candidatus Pacebacteria bacterium]|nr:polysaccharide deacetylase family protein [Candidatus Paceibacterota bacterium]
MISFTFDDGWKNQYTRALPILEENEQKGTFYIITKMPASMFAEGEGRMTKEEVLATAKLGHEIGAHSRTHPHLQISMPWKVRDEVRGSKVDLESWGLNVETFCYPYGRRNWYVDSVVKNAGYLGARLADGEYATAETNKFALEARCLVDDTTLEEVIGWIKEANGRWLILVFHQIESNPPRWGITPELFKQISDYVKNEQLKVVTVAEGIKKLYA